MLNIVQEENRRLKGELSALRRVIMQVEPVVMLDGRFEEMMTSPIAVIGVARQIIAQIPETKLLPDGRVLSS
ncbi:MAG: hypothetical protein HND44_06785 [Chloroflexi bacterium]|nr:hypothetical protein [Ardenticatenaceae bacterium]MBL1128195.1 hypothetical protein [Chloroflexota bacterium]NOG34268.1 hypothetical protein [Chloroflexota bacterium]GIK56382.1 MAG: hypothetical protein BroJett015_20450 [Chloroflexota bacterium]